MSAEPFRRRLRRLYGEAISWTPRMVVLAETPADQKERGFTPEKLAEASKPIAREHRMPIDTARPATRSRPPAELQFENGAGAFSYDFTVQSSGGDVSGAISGNGT